MNEPGRVWTHLALWVSDLDASVEFYCKYAGMTVLTERTESSGSRVAWLADKHGHLVLVLFGPYRMPLRKRLFIALMRRMRPPAHIGVECSSEDEVRRLSGLARDEGILRKGPAQFGGEIGFAGFISDPDGNDLELSHGQNVGKYIS